MLFRPYIGISHKVNDAKTVWTVKLREDAVFQDGTPITAADFKFYWEHGAKPENIVSGGEARACPSARSRAGMSCEPATPTEAEGLVVIDDHTLEITTETIPFPTWPLSMAAWHTGISKIDQVLTDDQWFTRPIGAGPYRLTIDPEHRAIRGPGRRSRVLGPVSEHQEAAWSEYLGQPGQGDSL